jgi:hypothetical protein
MRVQPLVAVFAVFAASQGLAGCKSESDEDAPPVPSAVAVPAPVATVSGAAPSIPAPVVPAPVVPAPVTPTPAPAAAGAKADAGAPVADPGAATDAGKSDAGAADGALSGKLAACASKCQGVLQNCLTPAFPADGGFPQMKDPKACQTAFDACRAGCAP